MVYPFKFKLGDTVEIVDGLHKGKRGQVKALESRDTSRGETRIVTVKYSEGLFLVNENGLKFI